LPERGPAEIRLAKADAETALEKMLSDGRLPAANKTTMESGSSQSETNEVFVDGAMATFRLITPRTMVAMGPDGDTLKFGRMTVRFLDADAVVWITSLDNLPIETSRRLLVAHVTDVQNTGAQYQDYDRKVLENSGGLPMLARSGKAEIELVRAGTPKSVEVWSLDMTGKRVAPVERSVEGKRIAFNAQTRSAEGKAVLYYEVLVESAGKPMTNKPKSGRR